MIIRRIDRSRKLVFKRKSFEKECKDRIIILKKMAVPILDILK